MLEPGSKAPAFSLPADDGRTISLAQLQGKKVVLYFYPKDDTSGCTRQACDVQDHLEVLAQHAVVLGVSPDSVESHKRFKKKYTLGFPLLADTDHRVAEAYGVWGEKTMYGKKYMGVLRTTFVIDERGRIAHVLERVKPEGHVTDVLRLVGGDAAKEPR